MTTFEEALALKSRTPSKGDSIYSVRDYYPTGYVAGTTDIKAALDAAIAAAPEGATVQLDPGASVFLTQADMITKALTIDLNGASIVCDPTPGSGTAGKPVFHFSGTISGTSHALNAVANAATTITLATAGNASSYAVGDYIVISDSTVVLPWDSDIPGSTPLYPQGYTGREEMNVVQSVNTVTGVITLNKPTRWPYATTPVITKITKLLKNPRVINAKRINEVDPGGLNTSSLIGALAPHLVHFQYSENPIAENVHFDGWNLHAVNFHRCINPHFRNSSGRNPYRPTDGGHGYLSRIDRCIGGSVDHTYSYRVRHHVDYVMTYNATSSHNEAVFPISGAFMGHGLGAQGIVSAYDSVEDAGAGWGWAVGNLAFGPDFDFTIIAPRYTGVGVAIVFHAKAQGLRVISPDLSTTTRCITMTTGANDLEIRGGSLRAVGLSTSSNSLLVREKAALADAYGLRPGSFRIDGVRLRGANPSISVDCTGSAELTNLVAEELDGAATGGTVNVIQFYTPPSALKASGNRFNGNYANGIHYTPAAPAGEYALELNDLRGFTSRAMTFPAAANLRFIGNTATNPGGGVSPWNVTGDLNTAKIGAAGYGAVVIGNSPRTLDEVRVAASTISGAAGTNRSLTFNTDDLARWILRTTATAESGSDAGSDLELVARTDAGAAGPQVFIAKRTGDSTWGASGKKLGFFGSAGAVKPVLSYSRATETAETAALRTALAALGLVTDSTTA